MKFNPRLSVAAVLAAALVAPAASMGVDSAVADQTHAQPAAATAQAPGKLIAHIKGVTANHRHVKGTFAPQQFSVSNGELLVTGVLSGVMTGHGKPTHFSSTETVPVKAIDGVALPTGSSGSTGSAASAAGAARTAAVRSSIVDAAATCQILNLNLGPLDLNLLGLQVHLNQVVLNIVAQSGAGNLLGNLLCSVAGLLDNTSGGVLSGLLDQISGLLNQILGALGGLTTV